MARPKHNEMTSGGPCRGSQRPTRPKAESSHASASSPSSFRGEKKPVSLMRMRMMRMRMRMRMRMMMSCQCFDLSMEVVALSHNLDSYPRFLVLLFFLLLLERMRLRLRMMTMTMMISVCSVAVQSLTAVAEFVPSSASLSLYHNDLCSSMTLAALSVLCLFLSSDLVFRHLLSPAAADGL